ncbi:MAG: NAD(P)/FAD-dependent oxidoreductase [Myxococcales bacterium]|nr:NAD(P)/FAD-dependent oxidoreductase [Myxococcales bacterium]
MAKIAIVGGGPGGSSFVLWALRAGVQPEDLVIFDKARFPRPKLCGGALTTRGTEALDELLGRPPGGGETRRLEFRSVLGSFPVQERGSQWLYDRALLDDQLLSACVAAGVEVRQGCAVREVEAAPEGWRLRFGRDEVERFEWVVGADGARGIVGRSAGLRGGVVGRLVEAVFEATDDSLDPATLYFDFDPIVDGIPGYAWLFAYPKPGTAFAAEAGPPLRATDGLWKLGIMDGRGVTGGGALRDWTSRFADRHGFRLVDEKIQGWPEHYWSPRAEAHRPGLLLTGEAWGIDPLLGEGIAPAIELSRYAAGRLKGALDAGRATIPGYEAGLLRTEEGANLRFQWRLAERLYGPNGRRWMRVLFDHRYMRELAASGTERYGRLQRLQWRLIWRYVLQVLRGGLPSNAPLLSSPAE